MGTMNKPSAQRVLGATNLATALMAGDRETFKAGYTLDNALIAAGERYTLTSSEKAMVRRILEKRERLGG